MAAPLLMLAGALGFPVLLLGFLLWMARLEDTLRRDVRRALRRPAPPPILAVPVRRPATSVRLPEQRPAPAVGLPVLEVPVLEVPVVEVPVVEAPVVPGVVAT